MISEDELSDIVDRFLEVGVPATAVSKALGVDPFVIRERQNELRVAQYGAAELSEALANMQWEALAQARAGGTGHFFGSCLTGSGEPRIWDVVITPIHDASGQRPFRQPGPQFIAGPELQGVQFLHLQRYDARRARHPVAPRGVL